MSLNLHPKHKALHLCPYSGKWELRLTKKRSTHTCQVSWCKNPPAAWYQNSKLKILAVCHKCRCRRYRANNPIKYAYESIKDSAKKRSISFTISLEDFTDWCNATGYADNKGKYRLTNHCDRIDATKGYEVGNLQLLTERENVQKRNKDIAKQNQQPDMDCPF